MRVLLAPNLRVARTHKNEWSPDHEADNVDAGKYTKYHQKKASRPQMDFVDVAPTKGDARFPSRD